jgi:hypothetical protein
MGIINEKRSGCAFVCLIIWGILLALFCINKNFELIDLLRINRMLILWSATWAIFGIALGLWNSRTDTNQRKPCHYITYYPFVWFFATVLAVAISADASGIRLYALSLATALATGFAGDRLAGNIVDLKN